METNLSNFVRSRDLSDDDETVKEVKMFLFYTTWCPHCHEKMPIWNSFKKEVEETGINKHKVICCEIDCDKHEKIADDLRIEGYPTIKLIYDNKLVELKKTISLETLHEFLQASLN